MPYIKEIEREKYNEVLDELLFIDSKGDLEYCIFKLLKIFMATREPRYSALHEAVYATMHCADEFRRRYLDVREDNAMKENGDVLWDTYTTEFLRY